MIALDRPRRRDAARLAALGGLAALLLLPTIGERWLADSHEARFAVLARDMLERGAPWDVEVGGQVYRNKPPLYPWSIALFSLPGRHVTEASAQAPLVLAAIATVGLTWWLGRGLLDSRAAWLGGLVLLTCFGRRPGPAPPPRPRPTARGHRRVHRAPRRLTTTLPCPRSGDRAARHPPAQPHASLRRGGGRAQPGGPPPTAAWL